MKRKSQLTVLVALVSLLLLNSTVLAELSQRTSLGLEGCAVTASDISSDSSLVMLGCNGPHGLYYSFDFGDSWTFAEGGDYSAGSATAIAVAENGVYVSVSGKLLKSALPLGSGSWVPDWAEVESLGNIANPFLYKSGTRYIILSNIGDSVKVFDTQTDTVKQSFSTPGNLNGANLAVGSDKIYLIIRNGSTASLYRTSYDPASATISGTWEDVSANLPPNSNFWNLFYASDSDKLFVGVRTAGAEVVDTLYVSTNKGGSFTATSISSVPNTACFADNVYIVGARVSLDDGGSFENIQDPDTEGDVRTEDSTCLIDPQDSNKAMIGSNRGLLKTSNLLGGASSIWTEAVNGLQAIIVYSLSQSQHDPDRVILGTSAGLAFTDNFTNDTPSWTFPICPGNDCVGGRNVLIDPLDDSIAYYGSGNIRKGTIDTSGETLSINWQDFSPTPGNLWFLSSMRSYSFMPDKLYCAYWRTEGETNGGLYWYDKSSGAEHHSTDPDIEGKPLSAFIALSEDIMFAAVAGFSDNPTSEVRGLLKSTDGGETWSEVSDSILSDTVYIYDFAFDEENDILYAASQQDPFQEGVAAEETSGTVYRLTKALAGTGSWERPLGGFPDEAGETDHSYSFTAVEVDPYTGYVYASAQNMLWRSINNGETWELFYIGLDSETTSVLHFDVATESADSVGIRANSSRLTQGANTGIYELSLNVSHRALLNSPLYMPWNGFLSMTNILELVNQGAEALSVTVTMYGQEGDAAQPFTFEIAGMGQYDLVLNPLEKFSADSYGIIKIEWNGNALDGRLAFYRTNLNFTDSSDMFDFAFMLPLENAIIGESNIAFNTYNPSTAPSDLNNLIANWLTIVNLDSQGEKLFTIERFDQNGAKVSEREVTIPSLGRMDIDGGHGSGANAVGFNKITPSDLNARYSAHIIRYGLNQGGGFDFAFPLLAAQTETETQWAPVLSGAGGVNWIEIVNTSSNLTSLTLSVFDNQGNELISGGLPVTLEPYKQLHVNASQLLSAGNSGAAKIESNTPDAIIAQSMFYFFDSLGSIDGAYGKQFMGAASGVLSGSWNLFLDMYNWLRIYNTTDYSQSIGLIVYNGNELTNRSIELPAKNGIDLGLHETGNYGTVVDSYGQVRISGSGLISEVLRLRPTSSHGIDFVAPTKVR